MADEVAAPRRLRGRAAAGEGDVEPVGEPDARGRALELGQMPARRVSPAGPPRLGPGGAGRHGQGDGAAGVEPGEPAVAVEQEQQPLALVEPAQGLRPVVGIEVERDHVRKARARRRSRSRLGRSQETAPAGKAGAGRGRHDRLGPRRAGCASRCRPPRAARAAPCSSSAACVQEPLQGLGIAPIPAAVAGADPDLAVQREARGVRAEQAGASAQGKGVAGAASAASSSASSSSAASRKDSSLRVHAAHALQAPVHGEDEGAALHQPGQPGGARPDRECLELGLAERGGHRE